MKRLKGERMNEKRFEKSKSDITDYRIYDYEKEDAYFIDCDDESTVDAIVDLMNQQQATIEKLQDLCGESDYENAKLRLKNKELQDKIDWLCEKYDYPKQELSETHYESKINY